MLREILRLHPPLHSLMRKVISDIPVTHIPGKEMVIPKGNFILAAPGVSAVDPEIWDRPNEFVPQRWMEGSAARDGKEGQVMQQLNDDAAGEKQDFGWGSISTGASSPYLPFGAGRHRCIGEQFAHVQLGTILATMVREFTWTLANGSDKVPEQDYTTMIVMPKKPRDILFQRRPRG